jgi:hypothetical protein
MRLTNVGATRAVPSGRRSETRVLQQAGPILTLTRSPVVPSKVTLAFCPGVVVVTVSGGPPGVVVPAMSAGTL